MTISNSSDSTKKILIGALLSGASLTSVYSLPVHGTDVKNEDININYSYNKNFKIYFQSEKYNANIQKLKEFRELKENWNCNGAKQFDNILIDKVLNIISLLKNQPKIYPTGRESIQLEFEKSNGDYLEFEVFKESINALIIINDNETEKQIDLESVVKEVDKFNVG